MDAAQMQQQLNALSAQDIQMQQQIAALNMQLVASAEQTLLMAQAMDSRQESGSAIRDLRRLLLEARAASAAAPPGHKGKDTSFVNTKSFEGGHFSGTAKERYKVWSKNIQVYLNS